MSSPAYELAKHLDLELVGEFAASSGWAISVGQEPTSPDTAITLYDTGGAPYFADIALADGGIMVRVRAMNYLAAYNKQSEIRDTFSLIADQQIEDHYYIGIWNIGDIQHIGRDDNNRFLLTANYRVERQPLLEST